MLFGKSRLIGLIKTIDNPPYFFYRVHHYLKRPVSFRMATKIRDNNLSDYVNCRLSEFPVETYDGSFQAVHPSVVKWEGEYWLAVTPYPYGMEEYENPSIFHGFSFDGLIPHRQNPIAKLAKQQFGCHYSDPCLFVDGDNTLWCMFRKTIRKGRAGKELNEIACSALQNGCWGPTTIICDSEDDPLLSPAFTQGNNGEIVMYHARFLDDDNTLVRTRFDSSFSVLGQDVVKCEGMPDGFGVWHLDISNDNGARGLFLLRDYETRVSFKLFSASFDARRDCWTIEHEYAFPSDVGVEVKHLYKSCFLPETNSVLVSYRDYKDRYRLSVNYFGHK